MSTPVPSLILGAHAQRGLRCFARKLHDFLRDRTIVPLQHCEPDALPEREAYWIRTLHTLIPHGLNSAYGKPYYPYDHSLFPLSLSTAGTSSPSWNTTQRLPIITSSLFVFVRAGLYLFGVFQRDFPTGFFLPLHGFSLEDVGQHSLKFILTIPPAHPHSHTPPSPTRILKTLRKRTPLSHC